MTPEKTVVCPRFSARKARPERLRFTFFDDPSGAIPLELPSQRHWVAGLVMGVFFLIFAAVAVGMIAKMSLHGTRDVFSLMMLLFDIFWLLGWSVGVFILGALTALFLFYRESARIAPGKLVHVPRLGPLKIVCEYDLAKISNLRLDDTRKGDQVRIRFDYDGRRAGIGDAMTREDAQIALEKLKSALPMSPRGSIGREERLEAARRIETAPAIPAPRMSPASSFALLAANVLPLGGVLLFGWDLAHVMILYWAESAVVGFYTALKLCYVAKVAAVAVVPFFVGHFGGFMAAHFLFVYGFFIRGFGSGPAHLGALESLREIFTPVWPALVALVVSHGVSFFVNFIGRREHAGAQIGP